MPPRAVAARRCCLRAIRPISAQFGLLKRHLRIAEWPVYDQSGRSHGLVAVRLPDRNHTHMVGTRARRTKGNWELRAKAAERGRRSLRSSPPRVLSGCCSRAAIKLDLALRPQALPNALIHPLQQPLLFQFRAATARVLVEKGMICHSHLASRALPACPQRVPRLTLLFLHHLD